MTRAAATPVWYFAYGSNMQSATLRGRRGIAFHRAVPARLSGWRLVFDKPGLLGTGESYANVISDPDATVLGVAFEISEADLRHVDLTEGVLIGNYRRVEVPLTPLADDGPRSAFTLTSERRDTRLSPSQRYMAMLIEGAIEHGLPHEHVAFLRTVPAREESAEATALRSLIDDAMRHRG
jgi:hypothetical protein